MSELAYIEACMTLEGSSSLTFDLPFRPSWILRAEFITAAEATQVRQAEDFVRHY